MGFGEFDDIRESINPSEDILDDSGQPVIYNKRKRCKGH